MTGQNTRAPQSDNEFLVHPTGFGKLLAENRSQIQQLEFTPLPRGKSLTAGSLLDLRKRAREDLIGLAHEMATEPVDGGHPEHRLAGDLDLPILVSGHQPEFYHPGVWFKSFLLAELAQRTGALAVNLVIDNDECRSTAIRVPGGTLQRPFREAIEFDASDLPIPYENRRWRDPKQAERFPDQVHATMGSLFDHRPILDRVWPELQELQKRVPRVGEAIALSRQRLEKDNGIANHEIALSRLCQQNSFKQFLASMLLASDELHHHYNDSLLDFRKANRIRSQTHPVPALVQVDPWRELPFWIWSDRSPLRGALYLQAAGKELILSDRDEIECRVSVTDPVGDLEALESSGIAIRPRALMTTLFARVYLADLFLHGIGGAKYDELTDRLIKRFYGIHPPRFLTATATHRLPSPITPYDDRHRQELLQRIREYRFHGETRLPEGAGGEVQALVAEKRKLLASRPVQGSRRSWHARIDRVNRQLANLYQEEMENCRRELASLENERLRWNILGSREYSFLLHPDSLIDKLKVNSAKAVRDSV